MLAASQRGIDNPPVIATIDLDNLTPLEAINLLNQIKTEIAGDHDSSSG